ncbi:transposase family Tnp2 protein, partial [Rhizoctonia solani 123E]
MAAIRLFGHISQRDYERIRYSFKENIRLMSVYRVHKKLAKLSGINPVTVDCCTNICHAYTGRYADEQACSTCHHPRFDSKNNPYKVFEYLPTTPRFQGYFNNPAMVQAMNYRHEYKLDPERIDEYFDSTNYADLRKTDIVVEGVNLGVKYFRRRRDIAYTVMLDGVGLFENPTDPKSSCWPIMGQNLNLPASQRAKLRNLIPLGVIPGPNQPKDFDSFLLPFVEEALEQARGVETYNVTTGKNFTLRAHPVIISGDMQAIKHVTQMKGPGGKSPCRACEIGGVYHTCRRSYYVPLTNPTNKPDAIPDDRRDPNANPGELTSFNPLDLPLRTMRPATTKTKRDKLETKFGLTGDDSILDRIPSIKRPDSYPHEFLHLFLLNHGKELFLLWAGKLPGLDTLDELPEFVLPTDTLVAIGNETKDATQWFPARFTRAMPNVYTSTDALCGESWCTWLVHIGPAVMRGRLSQEYYDHYMELVAILQCLLSVTNTRARIEQLKIDFTHYVNGFEELYYRYKYERLFLCKLTLHAILHVPDEVI